MSEDEIGEIRDELEAYKKQIDALRDDLKLSKGQIEDFMKDITALLVLVRCLFQISGGVPPLSITSENAK
jgi:chromosome segregation ATPase